MATTLKAHHVRAAHKALSAIEELHTNRRVDNKDILSRVDHEPYEKFHDADYEGECPICETLGHVKALRALLNGET